MAKTKWYVAHDKLRKASEKALLEKSIQLDAIEAKPEVGEMFGTSIEVNEGPSSS